MHREYLSESSLNIRDLSTELRAYNTRSKNKGLITAVEGNKMSLKPLITRLFNWCKENNIIPPDLKKLKK